MNITIEENIELGKLTTMKIGGRAQYFTKIKSVEQLVPAFEWVNGQGLPYFILSGGSNTIFDDGIFKGLVMFIDIKGFEVVEETQDTTTIKVGAGEDWDELVAKTVDMGLAGMEALSGIPGKTGATPYQNIGAYGQEVKDTIESVDRKSTRLNSSH